MEGEPFVFSGIFSSILSLNLLVSSSNLLIVSISLYFFRLFAVALPAVLSTHLSLSFPACPSVSPPVSVQSINSLLCLGGVSSSHLCTDPQDLHCNKFNGFLFLSPAVVTSTGALVFPQTSFCSVLEQWEPLAFRSVAVEDLAAV